MSKNLEKYSPYAHLLVVVAIGVMFFSYPRYGLPSFLHWVYVGSVIVYSLAGAGQIMQFFEEKDFKYVRKGCFLTLICASIVMIELIRNA